MINDTVFTLACFTSENKKTGEVIEVALWNQDMEPGNPIVTMSTYEGVQTLSLYDMQELSSIIQKLLDFAKKDSIIKKQV
ncbi:hypothetical protein [Bacteroides sp.]